jgi:transposase
MSREQKDQEQAKKRAEVILKVRSGQMTAKEAAKVLGVSRKTYYEWEERGLQGMMDALLNRPPGRPEKEKDPEKEELKKQVEGLEQELYLSEHMQEIRKLMSTLPSLKELDPDHPALGDKKKDDV